MRKILIVIGLLAAACFNQAFADDLSPTDDAYIFVNAPDTNYGDYTRLLVGNNYESYLMFDLSGYAGSSIQSANLNLYQILGNAAAPTVDIDVYRVETSWNEGSLTWNTMPSSIGEPVTATVGNLNGWNVWDVTSLAQSAVGGKFGLVLSSEYPTHGFRSNEGASNRPYLSVTAVPNAVPEPVSTVLFVIGGATLAVRQLRKKTK